MELESTRLLDVLMRHKMLVAVGIVGGVVAALLSSFGVRVSSEGSPALYRRTYTTYEASLQLMLQEPGFQVGRLRPEGDIVDPARTVNLTKTYAYLLLSDPVLRKVAKEPEEIRESLEANPVDGAPIVELKVQGTDPREVVAQGMAIAKAFEGYLKRSQEASNVPPQNRVMTKVIAAIPPVSVKSRAFEYAAMAFLGPVIVACMLALFLERVRKAQPVTEDGGLDHDAPAAVSTGTWHEKGQSEPGHAVRAYDDQTPHVLPTVGLRQPDGQSAAQAAVQTGIAPGTQAAAGQTK